MVSPYSNETLSSINENTAVCKIFFLAQKLPKNDPSTTAAAQPRGVDLSGRDDQPTSAKCCRWVAYDSTLCYLQTVSVSNKDFRRCSEIGRFANDVTCYWPVLFSIQSVATNKQLASQRRCAVCYVSSLVTICLARLIMIKQLLPIACFWLYRLIIAHWLGLVEAVFCCKKEMRLQTPGLSQ